MVQKRVKPSPSLNQIPFNNINQYMLKKLNAKLNQRFTTRRFETHCSGLCYHESASSI